MPEKPRGIREVPRHIAEQLERIDPNLHLAWSDQHERWILYERVRFEEMDEYVPVRTLEDPDTGEYIPLDGRFITQVHLGDTWRRPNRMRSVLDEIQEKNRRRMEAERKRNRDASLVAARDVARASAGHQTFDFGRL